MPEPQPALDPPPSFLNRGDGVSIAYHRTPGKSPGIVFMGGFMSDMTGTKALAIEGWARRAGQACLRFDYRGHGRSSGRFEDGTIGLWAEDALDAVRRLTEGPQIIVGSSMGGWIALLTALKLPERIAGLVGIAAAADFTDDLLWRAFTEAQRAQLERDGYLSLPSEYGPTSYIITRALIEDGRRHFLLGGPIDIPCPVRLLHGMRDPDVPWQRSPQTAERLVGEDARVILIKDGDHRLSRPRDLDLLTATIAELAQPGNQ